MGLKEVELIIPPKKQNEIINIKSLNGYDANNEKLDEGNTMTEHASAMRRNPVINEQTKPKSKVNSL